MLERNKEKGQEHDLYGTPRAQMGQAGACGQMTPRATSLRTKKS